MENSELSQGWVHPGVGHWQGPGPNADVLVIQAGLLPSLSLGFLLRKMNGGLGCL